MAISADKRPVNIIMKKELVGEIERRAESMQISVSKYIMLVMSEWIDSDMKLTLLER